MNFNGYVSWNPLTDTRFTLNAWGGYSHLTDGQSLKNHGWNVSLWTSLQQTIAKTWTVSLSAYMQTPGVSLQGKTSSMFSHDFSVSKSFMDKRLNITFNCGNPFKKYFKYNSDISGPNFAYKQQYRFCMQYVALGVSYRIGKLQARVKKAERTIENNDVKQGGGSSSDTNMGPGK